MELKDARITTIIDALEGIDENSVVLDVGGHEGKFCKYLAEKRNPHITVFEPLTEYYTELETHFVGNPKINIFQFALGDRAGLARLYKFENSNASSEFKWQPESKFTELIVPMLPLSSFLKKDPPVSLLALNCEGGEYNILKDLFAHGYMPYIDQVLVQFHKVDPKAQEWVDMIFKTMELTHNITFNLGPWTWVLWTKK